LTLDPVDGETNGGAAKQSEIESRCAGADATLVFLATDIQTQMQAVLDTPILSIPFEHLYGIELFMRETREQEFPFDPFLLLVPLGLRGAVNEST
jgi:hypothetical protein